MCCGSFERLPLNIEQLRSEVDEMSKVLPDLGSPVVLCHNDLLLRNIIYNEEQREYTEYCLSRLVIRVVFFIKVGCIGSF